MTLDAQGILAAVTIAIYVPVLLISFKLVAKHRSIGWILLLVFCMIRVLGGSLLVAAEDITPVNTSLYLGGYALESSGLSPLLMCTLGLLRTVFQTPLGESRYNKLFFLLKMLAMAALVLTISGISYSGTSSANAMRQAGVILFAVLYIIITGICLILWSRVTTVMRYRKELLKAISIALPFLAVRTLYSVLSTFSSSTFSFSGSSTPSDSDLAKFNIVTGEWQIYLVMDMLMEYAVVILYAVAGLLLPLDQDYKSSDFNQEAYPLSNPQY
ncbi:hypothetical protein K503DRAFT_858818 [Rhizopogon vinicolor AM-OR11-026]|uniref:DUF7702 domain-containing protein n=1 Tax=Rhizopogon vinicolor AM-OR11-026 TaxID=1314800 RepID=A0A1B7MRA6_9AGAM|nr:hypothetical protein K503DRAFT_858818 [Rhizopogon vinicolor AM-OR11-026]